MKILVAHNRYRFRGGEDTVVDAEVELLRRHGHEVLVYLRDNREISSMKVHELAIQTVWSSKVIHDVLKLAGQFKPDLIHAHNIFPLISPSLYSVASRFNIPIIQTLHNFRLVCPQATLLRRGQHCEDCLGNSPWRAILHRCYRDSLPQSAVTASMIMMHRFLRTWQRKVTRYIVLNQVCRDKFIEGGLPFERLRIKPNFTESTKEPQWQHRRGGLFVGRLSVEKGLNVLAEALIDLPGVVISVYGKGDMQSFVEKTLGFNYGGFQEARQLQARLHEAAYLVVPSTGMESFGLVAIEAFACGTPVIASAHGGLREIVVHGKTGLLVEPGNSQALARAIAYAETHPEKMKAMGQAARQAYLTKYTPDINYHLLMTIYREALQSLKSTTAQALPSKRLGAIDQQKTIY
jgi:glycosyltransferase involved in cell wall biosynthesis